MKITRACDYAMRALIFMASMPNDTVFMRAELSKQSNVPDSFLGKIMQSLAKSGILASERGKKGGFRLSRAAEQITIYDVVYAIEGDLRITDCLASDSYCEKIDVCKVHQTWGSIQDAMTTKLKSVSLKDLL